MDPLQNQIPQVPASPTSVPGIQGEGGGAVAPVTPELSQEEMRANLSDMMSKIDSKYQDFNSHKFSADNQLKKISGDYLSQLFDLLEINGVDPSNVEDVKAFLDKIKEQNPELGDALEKAFQTLLGEDPEVAQEPGGVKLPQNLAGTIAQNNMNTNISSNETLPPNL